MSVGVEDVAAVEFYLRCRIANPLKSWYKSTEIAEPCGFDRATEAGKAIASIADDDESDLEVERRSGYRRSAWGVRRRRAVDHERRRFWIENGERRGGRT